MFKVLSAVAKFFTIEPARKILALIFAFALWLFVAIDGIYNYEREIPVQYTNLSDKYMLVDSVPKLKVIFNGKGKVLINVWAYRPRAICSLAEVVPGKNVISTKDLIIPVKDVNVNFEAKYINVEVDERIAKVIHPVIPIKGTPRSGLSIAAVETQDTLVVTGPKVILQKLSEFTTESLDVTNHSVTFEKKIRMESAGELIKFSPENIRVKIVIDSTDRRVFNDILVAVVKNIGQNVRGLSLHIDTIVVAGARSVLSNLNKQNIIARIRTTDLVPGEYYLSPEIILPDFLTVLYYTPQRFRVFVY